jgi:hypothetical protein
MDGSARLRGLLGGAAATAILVAAPFASAAEEPGLLFRLSADKTTTADFSRGDPVPNFADKVKIVPNGRVGGALSVPDDGLVAWKAPGAIYGQRGTVSFFWRSVYPVGEGPFVLFRVGYADHTSWDMTFLRVDWNGHGYDAFVTDDNLARIRVSFTVPKNPAPDAWTHIAVAWDETRGIQLYVDGKLAVKKDQVAVMDTGLDQFGFAARVVSPHQVQARYAFMRGADYDELRIYDHALDAAQVSALAKAESPAVAAEPAPSLNTASTLAEWNLRFGWNRPGDTPPLLTAPVTRIRKVEFADAKDMKQWMWKATDGIAETTWPGVYNRSRLPGRNDYFPLPDWLTYVEGGKALTLTLPDEPWNYLEIEGAAYGDIAWKPKADAVDAHISSRAKDQERTFHLFPEERRAGVVTFTNIAQETPIQEIEAFDIGAGAEPAGTTKLTYTVKANVAPDSPDLDELNAFIAGRFPPAERATVVAVPDGAQTRSRKADDQPRLPIVHILIPYELGAAPPAIPLARSFGYGWQNMHDALDGVAIDLPALKGSGGETIPLNIQVKDPLWPMRNLMDVSVSVKPGEARTLWLDTRDRLLPNKSFYITIASGDPAFDAKVLDGMKIRLVFKDRQEGLKEHIADRFNQVKDNWGYLVEEHTASLRESLFRRLVADSTDLLRADPDNRLAREYWNDITYQSEGPLPFTQPKPPAGVPLWAFRQLEDLKQVRKFINWWIDERQVPFGDFGGGISDDTDLLEQWPALALMGDEPDKIARSHMALADAAYKDHMFTNGLATIQTDELHSYEDGINSNSEEMYIRWGDPKVVERLMTTVAAYPRIIQVNPAGHLHFVTNFYSGSHVFREGPWEWSKYYSYLVTHPGLLMGDFNADPNGRKVVIGLADGLLAHGKQGADGHWTWADEINWRTDATRGPPLPPNTPPMQLFMAAYGWTGDAKYLQPILEAHARGGNSAIRQVNPDALALLDHRSDWGADAVKKANGSKPTDLDRYLAWETTGDTKYLDELYGEELRFADSHMYMYTEGHWWIDRVEIPSEFLQRTRLGGIALLRNWISPGNTVSWRFDHDADAEKVAILVRGATPTGFTLTAFNTTDAPVTATMTGWNVTAGTWKVSGGGEFPFEKSLGTKVVFPPHETATWTYELVKAGPPTETRADLGIGGDDVVRQGRQVTVKVHSLGHVDAPAGTVEVVDKAGKVLASAPTPPLKAPLDEIPKTATVKLALPAGASAKDLFVRVRLPVPEVTQLNNQVPLN